MNFHPGFEADLHAAWQARDFNLWNNVRAIYADWLEENNYPLQRMARCPVRMQSVQGYAGKTPRAWCWRLWFDFPEQWLKPRSRWWANRRLNKNQLLGFSPFTLCCKGWDEYDPFRGIGALKFTLTFKPRRSERWVADYRHALAESYLQQVATDTDIHSDGFAAAFWSRGPGEKEVTPNDTRRMENFAVQGLLFQGREQAQ